MRFQSVLLLTIIVCIGLFFRLYNINWDQNFHLHPDERFLTMVGIKESFPKSLQDYFNPLVSPLNPTVLGETFFVYGIFPLTINVILAFYFHTFSYNDFTLQGRMLSAIFDTATIIVVYFLGLFFETHFHISKKIKFFAALFYALAVLPIQLSHFFTVDIFLSFFTTLSFCFVLYFTANKRILFVIASAVFLGLAIACKINALAILPLELLLLFLPFIQKKSVDIKSFYFLGIFCIFLYLATRIGDPYLFSSGNFLNFQINTNFLQSIQTLTYYSNPNVWYPPNVQWATKLPILFSLFNIVFFGLGIGISLCTGLGIFYILKTRRMLPTVIVGWVLLFFLYQSVQYVKTLRYFIFLYPFFAVFAGIGFSYIVERKNFFITLVGICLILFWPFAFLSIYIEPHTRIVASNWIYEHIPQHSVILGEYWDDPLPLANTNFTIDLLHVFDVDTQEKWNIINNQLAKGDYLILSSNRGWASISADSKQYPITSKWYRDLFNGKTSYKEIAEFHSFPSLSYLGIPLTFQDTIAEEAFTVYDHPEVMIFKKE